MCMCFADLNRRDGEDIVLQDLEGNGKRRAVREDHEVAGGVAVHVAVAAPPGAPVRRRLGDEVDVAAFDAACQGPGAGAACIVEDSFSPQSPTPRPGSCTRRRRR
jgi:hypothetical protein